MPDKKTGHCLCGNVTISTTAPTDEYSTCHCEMCRRWASAPNMDFSFEDNIEISGQEHIALYKSSDWGERGFCKNCGTNLFYHLLDKNHYYVSIGLFAGSTDPKMKEQIFIDRKPSGYSFEQKTKNYTEEEVFALFADND